MARDFASKPPPEPARSRVPGWVWMFTTVTAIAFVGFLYYLSQLPAESGGAEAVRKEVQNLANQPKTDTQPKAEPQAPKEDTKAPSLEQAFEFYKLLKDDEVPVLLPEPKAPTTTQPGGTITPSTPAPTTAGKRWMIQVASFSRVEDADRLRAELIINGLTEAHLNTVDLGDKGTYHRVMVGPFDNRSRLNKAQDILVGLRHEVMVRTLD